MKQISGRTKKILDFIGNDKNFHILDLGCSGGYQTDQLGEINYGFDPNDYNWLHKNLVDKYENVIGVEITKSHADIMNEQGFEVVNEDVQNFNLNKKFDFVVAGELIEHLIDIKGFLNSVKNHMNSQSKFIITTPFANSLFSFLYSFIYWPRSCSNDEHTLWFCPSTIKLTLETYGFEIERIEPIMDYRLTKKFSIYNIFVVFIYVFYPILPKRLKCNGMMVVSTIK